MDHTNGPLNTDLNYFALTCVTQQVCQKIGLADIMMVLPDLRGGGVERMRLVLAREFAQRGHNVEIVLLAERGELLPLVPVECKLHSLRVHRLRRTFIPLRKHILRQNPHVVLGAMWPLSVITVAAARSAGVRVVVSEHNAMRAASGLSEAGVRGMRLTMASAYRAANGVIGVSQAVVDELAELAWLPKSRFTVIHNPAFREALNESSPGPRQILNVGSLKPQKDQATLIRAFARAFPTGPEELVILGEGASRPALEALSVKLEVQERVRLMGFVADPSSFYAKSDLFVLSSRWEGFGNVLVEALSQGTPIVSTDLPPSREVLCDGRYGRIVPCGDVAAMALAMRETLEAPPPRAELLERAHDFSPARIGDQYLRLLL